MPFFAHHSAKNGADNKKNTLPKIHNTLKFMVQYLIAIKNAIYDGVQLGAGGTQVPTQTTLDFSHGWQNF
ncbi:MAG: hypothetical protein DRR08_18860 [Candidatus Parabeggiatoa sp. nov. 2]|nr:MAG: hypothetical protein B6247_24080 [Beggiatoa sp. 4572_84]RKZ57491.1 MAG: hypothetical protein DRR08_18860 [Gammaproteobacteria bacterium]